MATIAELRRAADDLANWDIDELGGRTWTGAGENPAIEIERRLRAGEGLDKSDPLAVGRWLAERGADPSRPDWHDSLAELFGGAQNIPQDRGWQQGIYNGWSASRAEVIANETGSRRNSQTGLRLGATIAGAGLFAPDPSLAAQNSFDIGTNSGLFNAGEVATTAGTATPLQLAQVADTTLDVGTQAVNAGDLANIRGGATMAGDASHSLLSATVGDIASLTPSTLDPTSLSGLASGVTKWLGENKDTIKTAATYGGLLASIPIAVGATKAIVGGSGGGSTVTQQTVAAPETPDEIRVRRLQIEAFERQAELEGRLTPVLQRQIDAATAELDTAAEQRLSHDPNTIRAYVQARLKNSDGSINEAGVREIADAMRRYNVTATEVADATGYSVPDVVRVSGVPLTTAERNAARQQEILDIQLSQLEQGTAATEAQAKQINTAFDAASTAATTNIERFRDQTIARITEEVAAASGLSPTDTPIQSLLGTTPRSRELGTGLSSEVDRQRTYLAAQIEGGRANAMLNYPLAAQEVSNATARTAGGLNQAAMTFQQQLEQTAANNRYRLFANPMTLPPTNTGAGSLALGMGNQRLNLGATSATSTRGLGLPDYAQAALGVGSIIRGLQLF